MDLNYAVGFGVAASGPTAKLWIESIRTLSVPMRLHF